MIRITFTRESVFAAAAPPWSSAICATPASISETLVPDGALEDGTRIEMRNYLANLLANSNRRGRPSSQKSSGLESPLSPRKPGKAVVRQGTGGHYRAGKRLRF